MHLFIGLIYNLDTSKRVSRQAEVFDPQTGMAIDSPLTGRLLLPRLLPQEWLPAELRTGRSGPLRSWTDRSLFVQDEERVAPEGLQS